MKNIVRSRHGTLPDLIVNQNPEVKTSGKIMGRFPMDLLMK